MTDFLFEAESVREIFPTYVGVFQLHPKDYGPINQALVEKLREMRAASGKGPDESMQTGHDLHEQDVGRPLVRFFNESVARVLSFLDVDHDGFQITGCWANVNAPGNPHKRHNHPNNYLSGVYYAQVQEGANTITFEDPRPQGACFMPRFKSVTAQNCRIVTPQVREGMLLVFPSWLMHFVMPNESNKDRISVSFNINFPSFVETISPPRWQADVYF